MYQRFMSLGIIFFVIGVVSAILGIFDQTSLFWSSVSIRIIICFIISILCFSYVMYLNIKKEKLKKIGYVVNAQIISVEKSYLKRYGIYQWYIVAQAFNTIDGKYYIFDTKLNKKPIYKIGDNIEVVVNINNWSQYFVIDE